MKISAIRNGDAWDVYPQSGLFCGKLVGRADGLAMMNVRVTGDTVTGEVTAVWGLEVLDPMVYNDPRTIRGLGVGRSFDMREQVPLVVGHRGLQISPGLSLSRARNLWVMGSSAQGFDLRGAVPPQGGQKHGAVY